MVMNAESFTDWLTRFCRGWEEGDTELLVAIFTHHATFWETPFGPPEAGAGAMREGWDELYQYQEERRMDAEILAIVGQTGIARWRASYRKPADGVLRELDGIIVTRFASDGRCCELIEWRHARDNGIVVPT